MIVARGRHRHAQQLLVVIYRLDDAREEHEEAQVVHGALAGVEQVLLAGRQRPVVVLARAVDALERLFMLQAHEAVMAGQQAHLLHGEKVLIHAAVHVREDGSQLVLRRSHLVVLRASRHAERPQLVVQFLHELVDGGADGAEVMLVELLALAGGVTEQGAARHDEILALGIGLLGHEEVFLLGAQRGHDALARLAEQSQHAVGLLLHRAHRAQKRRLLVEGLAGVGAEGRRDAQHLVLDERVGRGIPSGVAAGLERGAQAAGREAGGVGLALDQLFSGEAHDGSAVAAGVEEAVVLLRRDAGQGLEPMREVGGALLDGPFLHGVGHDVRYLDLEGLALFHGFDQALVRGRRQTLLHRMLVEYHRAVDFRNLRHENELLTRCVQGGARPPATRADEPPAYDSTAAGQTA